MLLGRGQIEDGPDVLLFEAARLDEEFIPVPVEGQVAGRDHHGPVETEALRDRGHEHGGRGSHAHVRHRHALRRHRFTDPAGQIRPRQAGIPAHGHPQRVLSKALPQPQGKAPADVPAGLLRQIHVLPGHPFHGHPADVAAVLQT